MVRFSFLSILLSAFLLTPVHAEKQLQDSRDGRVHVEFKMKETDLLTRQYRMMQYRVYSNDAFITLDVEVNKYPQYHLLMLPVRRLASPLKNWKYLYRFNVLGYFSEAGRKQLTPPVLRYSEGGRVRYQFRFSPITLSVKSLPPYLPPYIPLGQLELTSTLPAIFSQLRPARPDTVYYWNITVRGHNITDDALPELRQQIRSNHQIRFLPAKLSRSQIRNHDSVIRTLHYSIPFIIRQSGWVRFPELRLQYFDPASGRMRVSYYRTDSKPALNLLLQGVLILLFLLLLIRLIFKVKPGLLGMIQALKLLQTGRQQLKQANTPVEIRQSMRILAQAFGWPANMTLSSWQQYWQMAIRKDRAVIASLNALTEALYGKEAAVAVGEIKKSLLCHGLSQIRMCLRQALSAKMEPSIK